MIKLVVDIYWKLLRVLLLLVLGGGLLATPTEKVRIVAKKALVRGLVQIPKFH
jgi:hypothetical protein